LHKCEALIAAQSNQIVKLKGSVCFNLHQPGARTLASAAQAANNPLNYCSSEQVAINRISCRDVCRNPSRGIAAMEN
jgi:hypothetical protein